MREFKINSIFEQRMPNMSYTKKSLKTKEARLFFANELLQ